jgi:hypothetical protein
MRKISLFSLIAVSLVHFRAAAQIAEVVCYYQVAGGGNLLSAQDLLDLKYKRRMPVVAWTPGKRSPTLFGYGPDRFSEYTYTVQHVGLVPRSEDRIEVAEDVMKEMKKDFGDYGVIDPKVSFMGCKTTPLQQ